ncbi:winged helix-turn-helix transcriptional regulator [candidate division KSB1 bacterium]|nr:winged helix-turn-helix transcriptional regulator [candidate division KSB1 bacterium]
MEYDHITRLFKSLSDKNRIRILKMLEERPLCVCEIKSILGLATSTTSKHLSILKDAQLIFEQKEHKWVNYHLNRASQHVYIKAILPLIRSWLNDDPIILKDKQQVKNIDRTTLCSL